MAYFKILLFFIIHTANANLPELMTKQALHNIRLTTGDGKYTYYQRGSESLLLSSNYSVKEILKTEYGSHFDITSTTNRNNILITVDNNFHQKHSITSPRQIYWSTFGSDKAEKLSIGNSALLHLQDQWASVYSILEKKIKFFQLNNSELNFSINITNTFNPYFIPNVEMANKDNILYTDINKEGLFGLLSYNKKTKKNKLLYKVDEADFKIEFCLSQNKLIVGQFSHDSKRKYSQILLGDPEKGDFEELYLSKSNDIGNIICPIDEKAFYFIKETTKNHTQTYDAFRFDLETKKLTQLSKMDHIKQIIEMDGMLLVPSRGKYFVLKGNSELNVLDRLKE